MTEQQKRVIRDNPHLQSGKLAKLLGINAKRVDWFKYSNKLNAWSYTGVNIPFLHFDKKTVSFKVRYRHQTLFSGSFKTAIKFVDHLLWCIENNMFNQPRIEHPYFENLGIEKWRRN